MTPASPAALPTAADLLADPAHGGPLAGSHADAEASGDGRTVRIGLWLEGGRVVRARFRATVCASLIACAEAACRDLEEGVTAFSPSALAARIRGFHPGHLDRAALVARAACEALAARRAGDARAEVRA